MPLPVNSRLGPYEIKSPLGAGGMGEVYRARDSRLNRDVAIKILRTDGASGSDLRNRFEREARAVAALNHPNVVAVYDFGIELDQQYIVSELIDGESLRSLLRGKVVPARKLVDIATQVADGLAAAHSAGIVHRDLKPENIMIAKDGRVKILDFGLARQVRPSGIFAAGSQDDTVSNLPGNRDITGEGAVIGTPNYMSPEQALGRELDYRSDQFSFGLILYELASGKQAFTKTSTIETMAAIVREEPAPMDDKLPPPLRWIIDRCLAKEPDQRYESTRDLYRDLKNLRDHFSEAYSSESLAPIAVQKKRHRWRVPALVAACCLISGILVYLLKPTGQPFGNYRYTPFAVDARFQVWSPDGKAVAYASDVDGIFQVFLRYLNSSSPVQLTHGKHDVVPIGWSSDETHIILHEYMDAQMDRLYTVATVGGDPEFIMETNCSACTLSRDGKALATFSQGKDMSYGVFVSDPLGSPLRPYTPAPFTSKGYYGPPALHFSPNGRKLLLSRSGDLHSPELWLLHYPAGGNPPKRILQDLTVFDSFAWMPDSLHIVISGASSRTSRNHLWIADTESGKIEPLTNGAHNEDQPAVSPDGERLLFNEFARQFDIVSISVEDGAVRPLITAWHRERKPAWSARQQKLVWVSDRSGSPEIWMRGSDGSERSIVTAQDFPADTTTAFMNPALSPEGDRVIFGRIDTAGLIQLWISSLAGGPPSRLTNNPAEIAEFASNWSSEGKYFVFLQQFGGKTDLAKVRVGSQTAPVALKPDVHWNFLPDWSPTGEWITYEDDNGAGLITPDGKTLKSLGKLKTKYLTFSKDGKTLFGINADEDHATLFSLDVASLKLKTIKDLDKEWRPSEDLRPGIRFSLAPDGKSFVYAVSKAQSDLWMLEGFRQPSWLDRFAFR